MITDPATALEQLTSLLGDDVFFVPCHWVTKKPAVTYAERPFEGTKTPAYLALLNAAKTNIAIYLGNASGGLCAIDFDVDKYLVAFLQLNPELAATTRVVGSRGAKLLVRMAGEFPGSCKAKQFEWRANGNLAIVHGRHPDGVDYRITVSTPPIVLPFEKIIWPTTWEKPWLKELEQQVRKVYGEPFYTNKDGRITTINEPYWAGVYGKEHRILYEPDEQSFYQYNPQTGLYHAVALFLSETVHESEYGLDAHAFSQRLDHILFDPELDGLSLMVRMSQYVATCSTQQRSNLPRPEAGNSFVTKDGRLKIPDFADRGSA
jgi:hypothetical protein